MPTVTVKNIPEGLYERLKASAKVNRRSINSEIIVCIERTVASHQIDADEVIENARRLRRLTAEHPISHNEFDRAKSAGRP